ncbi:transmembrane protein, putative (macronuclear) [Tetrahymena thermophila SB210]|uniref:Transmembrane protein, putative n=1 Tax=Tetrahymena thermophila (strain SB210) TaxID=312017 RepID=Q23KI2_TETTS|nr:transmembrane protein, putative [Tetrahymena thermophila SB210]EAR96861.2 transmembrane protein, putative [Tetrahymena thermophila SB210]|eukprot:XP_001017106.2 transmembrane protein, putative [Tetrahymena thermophila SB210]
MFPIALFGYSYLKYKAIITTTIMNNIAPLIEEKRKLQLQQKEKEINYSQTLEKIQQTRRRGLNQINNFQDALNQYDQSSNKANLNQSIAEQQEKNLDMSMQHRQHLRQSLLEKNYEKKQTKNSQKTSIKSNFFENSDYHVNQKDIQFNQQSPPKQLNNHNILLKQQGSNENSINIPMNILDKYSNQHQQQTYESKNSVVSSQDEEDDSNYMQEDDDKDEESQRKGSLYVNKLKQGGSEKKGFARIVQIVQQKNIEMTGKNSQFAPGNSRKSNINGKIFNQQEDEANSQLKHNLDVLLDANSQPSLQMLVFDKNLNNFFLITNIIQTFFEALPLSILQYINNELGHLWYYKDGSYNYLVILSFFSSCLMIFQFGVQLIQLLYSKNISIFYQTMQYLNNYNLQNQKKNSSSYNLGSLFPMTSTVNIQKINQLEKLSNLSQNALDKITILTISLPDNAVYFEYIMHLTKESIVKIKNVQQLHLNFKNNRIKELTKLIEILNLAFSQKLLSTISLKLQDNIYDIKNSNELVNRVQLWEYNKIKKESVKINKIIIDDYQTIIGIKNDALLQEKYRVYKELIHIPKNQQKKYKFYFQSNSEQMSYKTFTNILSYVLNYLQSLKNFQVILFQVLGEQSKYQKLLHEFNKCTSLNQYVIGTEDNGILGSYGFDLEVKNQKVVFTKQNFDLQLDSQILILDYELQKYNLKNNIEQFTLNYQPQIMYKTVDKEQSNDCLISRGIDIITKYTKVSSLEFILRDCVLQHRFLVSMKDIFTFLPKLQALCFDFSTCTLDSRFLHTFLLGFQFSSNKLLKFSIDLSGVYFDESIFLLFKNTIKQMENLEDLTIKMKGIPFDHFQDNKALIQNSEKLRSIEIQLWENSKTEQKEQPSINLFDGTLSYLQKIKLSLRKNQIKDDNLQTLVKKIKTPESLEELYLDYQNNLIEGNSLQQFSSDLQIMCNLNHLTINLHQNQVGDFFCKQILRGCIALQNCKKMELDFGFNNITDDSAIDWIKNLNLLPCTQFFSLNFENNHLTNQFIDVFCSKLQNLQQFASYCILINNNKYNVEKVKEYIVTSLIIQNQSRYIGYL